MLATNTNSSSAMLVATGSYMSMTKTGKNLRKRLPEQFSSPQFLNRKSWGASLLETIYYMFLY
jgi:hypothetical protein